MKSPVAKRDGLTVGVWLQRDLVDRLDALAECAGITRSKLLANIIEMNVKSLERADSAGILPLVLLMRDLQEGLRGWVRQIEDDPETVRETWVNGGYYSATQE